MDRLGRDKNMARKTATDIISIVVVLVADIYEYFRSLVTLLHIPHVNFCSLKQTGLNNTLTGSS